MSVVATMNYTVIGPLTRISPLPTSPFYIPAPDFEGVSFLDVRPFGKMLVEVEADQPITVELENSPTGLTGDAKALAGYMIDSAVFDTARRNTIAMDGADAAVGFIRLKITTGATAPTFIKVWVEVKI